MNFPIAVWFSLKIQDKPMTWWPSTAPGYMKDPNAQKKVEIAVSTPEESTLHFHFSSVVDLLWLYPLLIWASFCKGGILPKIRAIALHWNVTHINDHNETANEASSCRDGKQGKSRLLAGGGGGEVQCSKHIPLCWDHQLSEIPTQPWKSPVLFLYLNP